MKIAERIFKIDDIDAEVVIEVVNKQKDIFDFIDEYVENLQYDWFDGSDDSFEILYKDGTSEYINDEYNGHKIRRNNIAAMAYSNACTTVVYGNFEINEYGVVYAAEAEKIADTNIIEIR